MTKSLRKRIDDLERKSIVGGEEIVFNSMDISFLTWFAINGSETKTVKLASGKEITIGPADADVILAGLFVDVTVDTP